MKLVKSIFIILAISIVSCTSQQKPLILISKDGKERIEIWLKNIDSNIETKVFYSIPTDSMNYYLHKAEGIVISGGEDVNPKLYDKPSYVSLCDLPDDFRDSIEIIMIKFAIDNKIPLLGICRGVQIMNVVNGGTLIPDIPTFYPNSNINHRSKINRAHFVIPEPNSWIENNLTYDTIWVNSRHHQSVDIIAPQFKVSAYSPDSVVESIEIKTQHPFAIGVQWHPESLEDEISHQIGALFLNSIVPDNQ